MKIFSALFKTTAMALVQVSHTNKMKKAQKNAFSYACKKARGTYDTNWHKNYRRKLKQNQQKAINKKELITTFINSI